MVSITDAREAIYGQFINNFSAVPADRVTAENEEFSPPSGVAWVRLSVSHRVALQDSLGGEGSRKFSRTGAVFVQVFTPLDQGVREADTIAQAAKVVLEGKSLSGNDIRLNTATIREGGPENGLYSLVVEVPFVYTETR